MVAAASIVFLVCAFVINAQDPEEKCTTIETGNTNDTAFQLPLANLTPSYSDWQVTIPRVPQCTHGFEGAKAVVCDYDVKPNATFTSLNEIFIHRNGKLEGNATVNVTVYCKTDKPDDTEILETLIIEWL